jgi:hypothetical protein
MFRHRQRLFGRKARRRVARVSFLVVLALLGTVAGRAIQDELEPQLTFSPTASAFALDPSTPTVDASTTAMVGHDLPELEELWGVGGGPAYGVRYVEAPTTIRAGAPLRVSVHGTRLDGFPFAGALVEVTWKLGDAIYRDVTYTDGRGDVEVNRQLDAACKGKPCVVGVRMYQDNLQALAYTKFTAR